MYFNRFNILGVDSSNWPQDRATSTEEMDAMFSVADACLNSWEEAHDAFDEHQGDDRDPDYGAFRAFVNLTSRALHMSEFIPHRYALEAVAFALLQRWIEVHQAEKQA